MDKNHSEESEIEDGDSQLESGEDEEEVILIDIGMRGVW